MPFTLAHPAVVIPFRRFTWLSVTGLIMGSIVPDMEFFIQMREVENIGHKWYGIFVFDLPLALLLSFLFHNLIRNAFIFNLPGIYRQRLIHITEINWNEYAFNNFAKLTISVLAGIFTHLLWDSFTHYDGFFVELIPALSDDINIIEYKIPVYLLLQVIFSLLGMFLVHFQLMRLDIVQKNTVEKADFRYWMIFALIFSGIFSVRIIAWPEFNTFGGLAIAIMGSLFYSWLPVSVLFNNNYKKERVLL